MRYQTVQKFIGGEISRAVGALQKIVLNHGFVPG
jgi:hypothetical protein